MNKICKIALVWSFIFLVSVSACYAALQADPAVTEIALAKGEDYDGFLRVASIANEDLEVVIEPVDWLKKYLKKTETAPVESWLEFQQKSFILPVGMVANIPYKIKVAQDLEDEQMAQVFFAFKKPGEERNFKTRLGVAVYLGIKDTMNLESSIVDASVVSGGEDSEKFYITLSVFNSGNVHIRPFGKVVIEDSEGNGLHTFDIAAGKVIFPDTKGEILVSNDMALATGKYKIVVILDCGMYKQENKVFFSKFFEISGLEESNE